VPSNTPVSTATATRTPTAVPSATPSGSTTIDSRSAQVTYSGWWPTRTDASAVGGSERVGEFGGDSATFTFVGSQVRLVYRQDTNRGKSEVRIDGAVVGQINQYGSPTAQRSVSFEVSPGRHTVKVTANRTKQAQSSGLLVGVDAFIVNGS
jgi:hypothetical protein